MTRAHRQEALALAYVQAVAAHAGASLSYPDSDYGIDFTLNEIERKGGVYSESGIKIDVQLKSTASSIDPTAGVVYDLDVRAYDVLRTGGLPVPRVLVLVVLPTNEKRWTTSGPTGLTIHHGAFWLSLEGRDPISNRRTVRVTIPHADRFTPDALRSLFEEHRRRTRS